jgi:integrase
MAVHPGRRKGTHRVRLWSRNRAHEWIVEGSRGEAKMFEAQKKIELGLARPTALRVAPTFCDFCANHYRPHAETHLARSTWKNVRIYQVATLAEFFGKFRLTDITDSDVDRYKLERRQTIGPSSVNNELRVLRAMLNWAKEQRHMPVADLGFQMLPTQGDERVRFWTQSEIGRLYESSRQLAPDFLPVLIFLLNTGCRKGEAIAAQWSWVDLEGRTLRIPVTKWWQPKNKKPREVPLSDALATILAGPRRHPEALFPSILGEPYKAFPKETYWKVRDAAGLEGGVHTTRHTFASHFLSRVPDLFLLSQVLGHSHQRVTELYAHLLPGHLARARNAVNLGPGLRSIKTGAGPGRDKKEA